MIALRRLALVALGATALSPGTDSFPTAQTRPLKAARPEAAPTNKLGAARRRRRRRQPLLALHAANAKSDSDTVPKPWRSGMSTNTDGVAAVRELCSPTAAAGPSRPDSTIGEKGLAFLFVGQRHSKSFVDIVETAHALLGPDTTLLSLVGGGVVGGGIESDDPAQPAVSLLSGVLPSTASVEVFMFGGDEPPPPASSEAWTAIGRASAVPSYVVFADPWSPIQDVLDGLDGSGASSVSESASGGGGAVVAGGISCPTFGEDGPTVAINGRAYPRGSVVGVGLSGTVGLQAVVAQGCRAVGPAFGVTEAEENKIIELDGKPAMEQMLRMAEEASDDDRALFEASGFLCGLAAPGAEDPESGDYLVRQIIGVQPPAIVIGDRAERGDVLRFHVRDAATARDDLANMVRRARTERMFAGPGRAGLPLASIQISCVARGRSLFGDPNVDLEHVGELVSGGEVPGDEGEEEDVAMIPPVAGFFANGEIGPVGIAGVGLGAKRTHMHGFTSIAAVLCDFGGGEEIPSGSGADDTIEDSSAWG